MQYGNTFNTFSGVDMICTFGGVIIGELQGISFTVTREVAPLYTMGSADPRSFSRGKRGIAGALAFLVLDRDALLDSMIARSSYMANAYEIVKGQRVTAINDGQNIKAIAKNDAGTVTTLTQQIPAVGNNSNIITSDKVIATPRYADQILPFDVVISAGNEFGHFASMAICGIQIMNSGSGMSIDDISTDQSMTFVATSVKPWSNQYHINMAQNRGNVPYGSVGYSGPIGVQS